MLLLKTNDEIPEKGWCIRGNYSSTEDTLKIGGNCLSKNSLFFTKENFELDGLICSLGYIFIKSKKFTFTNNGFINAQKGAVIVAEDFDIQGGKFAYPHLVHFIRVPQGTVVLDETNAISTQSNS
jgi:hypothetical protein